MTRAASVNQNNIMSVVIV